jgi:cellulase
LIPGASAHGFVNLIKAGGKFYPGWDLNYYYQTNPPAVAGWSTTALDSGFVRFLQPTNQRNGSIAQHRLQEN